ncbi:hypothetical protein PR048_002029 [Dryococelus australis]|uniref:Uncharacterized protein n=1 Tax=Dryococelus australis TaxID=614101 RepID=A0ABQ9IJ51_9NEOP|nr:hypothetical protein PR048_002029 [Dryococelus australis]
MKATTVRKRISTKCTCLWNIPFVYYMNTIKCTIAKKTILNPIAKTSIEGYLPNISISVSKHLNLTPALCVMNLTLRLQLVMDLHHRQYEHELQLHQRRAEAGQTNIQHQTTRAKSDPNYHVITFDLQQALSTPRLSSGRSDEIVSCLKKYLEVNNIRGETLIAISDNCFGHDMNWNIIGFWLWVVSTG